MVRIGELRDILQVIRITTTPDGLGGSEVTKTVLGEYYTHKTDKSVNVVVNNHLEMVYTITFIVRIEVPVTTSDMIRFNGVDYTINTITELDKEFKKISVSYD